MEVEREFLKEKPEKEHSREIEIEAPSFNILGDGLQHTTLRSRKLYLDSLESCKDPERQEEIDKSWHWYKACLGRQPLNNNGTGKEKIQVQTSEKILRQMPYDFLLESALITKNPIIDDLKYLRDYARSTTPQELRDEFLEYVAEESVNNGQTEKELLHAFRYVALLEGEWSKIYQIITGTDVQIKNYFLKPSEKIVLSLDDHLCLAADALGIIKECVKIDKGEHKGKYLVTLDHEKAEAFWGGEKPILDPNAMNLDHSHLIPKTIEYLIDRTNLENFYSEIFV